MTPTKAQAVVSVLVLLETAVRAASNVPPALEALAAQTSQAYLSLAIESSDNTKNAANLLRRESMHTRSHGHASLAAVEMHVDDLPAKPAPAPPYPEEKMPLDVDGRRYKGYDVSGRPFHEEQKTTTKPPSLAQVKPPINLSVPLVWCGGHSSPSCTECSRHGKGQSFCNGDCRWEPELEECTYRSELVWCGAHAAESCQACAYQPDGSRFVGKQWCNGECYWEAPEFEGGLYGQLAETPWWRPNARGSGQCVPKYPNPPPFKEARRRRTEVPTTLKDIQDATKTVDQKRKKLPKIARTHEAPGKTLPGKAFDAEIAAANPPPEVPRGDEAIVYYASSIERRNTSDLDKTFWCTKTLDATLTNRATYFREDGADDLQAIVAFKIIAFLFFSILVLAFIFLVAMVSVDTGYDALLKRERKANGLPQDEG